LFVALKLKFSAFNVMVGIGHLAIHFFEISRCTYDTDTTSANGKVAVGDLMYRVPNAILTIQSHREIG
jgi:hypothetical protein